MTTTTSNAGEQKPPVLMLGGQENALSLTRSLGKAGVSVSIASDAGCVARPSRFCQAFFATPDDVLPEHYWAELLLHSGAAQIAEGTVILCGSDEAVGFVAENHAALSARYRLEINPPALQLDMLDKQETIRHALAAGVPAPKYVPLDANTDVNAVLDDIELPILVKPLQTHLFKRVFGTKMILCHDRQTLRESADKALKAGVDCMLSEFIPGGDDMLAGYHTYIDDDGERRFEFTKKLHRRFPENFGIGVNHVTVRMDDVITVGRQFFEGVAYRGIGNIEFKFDARHNLWKIIECNPRFTAIQELILRSGLDTGSLVYAEATGGNVQLPDHFREQLQLIHIKKDFQAYRVLHAQGRLGFGEWIASVPLMHVRPYFSWSDPMPGTTRFLRNTGKFFQRRVAR